VVICSTVFSGSSLVTTFGFTFSSGVCAAAGSALATASSAQGPSADVLGVLSEREREVFRLAADCRLPQEIAGELCLARKTVDTHLNRIHRKLGLRSRADLVKPAAGLGLVHGIRSAREAM